MLVLQYHLVRSIIPDRNRFVSGALTHPHPARSEHELPGALRARPAPATADYGTHLDNFVKTRQADFSPPMQFQDVIALNMRCVP